MAQGFDCATPLTAATAAAFKRDGYAFVCRYLVPSTSWKALKKSEADLISAAGLQIVSVFETTANRALGGRNAGRADGRTAVQIAKQVGQPEGSTIYFAVDFDALPSQMTTIIDYIRGANEATPAYDTGVYGSYAVVQAVRSAGACPKFWQTYAWSRGQVASGIHLYQYDNGPSGQGNLINGIMVDLDESYGEEGWWNTLAYMIKPEDANEIIERFLAHEFDKASDADKIRRNQLANELRKASGQPEQVYNG